MNHDDAEGTGLNYSTLSATNEIYQLENARLQKSNDMLQTIVKALQVENELLQKGLLKDEDIKKASISLGVTKSAAPELQGWESTVIEAILSLCNIVEQDIQLNNLVQHAAAKPTLDKIRTSFGKPPAPATVGGVLASYVPVGPGCIACKRTPAELIESGHGPHL